MENDQKSTISENEILLSTQNIHSLFWHYSAPGIAAMLFLAMQSIADGIIVGRLISATALAAVNIAIPVYTLVTAISMIIGVGTQAQIGIRTGLGDYAGAKTALRSGFTGLLIFAVTATCLICLFANRIATILGANDELKDLSVGYIHGVMPWLAGIGMGIFFDYTLKALGHPRFAMTVTLSTVVLNIVLSAIFVTVFDMGTFGAGLGTGISFSLSAIVLGVMVLKQLRHTDNLSKTRGRFSFRSLGHIFYNGSSEGLSEIAFGITMFLFNITLMKYSGKDGVAAFTLINYITFVGISVILGISNGVIPILSYNYGASLVRRVKSTVGLALKYNFACGMTFMLILWIFGRPIVSLFIDPSEQAIIDLTVRGARIVSLAFLANGMCIFATSFFTAIDKAGLSLLVASLRGLILIIIGIFTLPVLFGTDGVWLTIPVADFITSIVVIYLAAKWKSRLNITSVAGKKIE